MIEDDLLEGGGAFGEEDDVEGVVGPVGERDFDRSHAEFGDCGESCAVDVSGGRLFHPFWEVADAEACDRGGGVEVEE